MKTTKTEGNLETPATSAMKEVKKKKKNKTKYKEIKSTEKINILLYA